MPNCYQQAYYLFAALALLLSCVNCVVVVGNDDPGDTHALHDLFAATGGSTWFNRANWTLPVSFCTWYGLSCNCSSVCRVSSIVMEINNMTGTLPSSLANLTALTKLDLYANSLIGSLPAVRSITFYFYFRIMFSQLIVLMRRMPF
jgi:hypothetical protein